MSDLDSVLDETQNEAAPIEPQAPAEPEPTPQPQGETPPAPPAEKPAPVESPEVAAFKQAAISERQKRQELERQLAEIRQAQAPQPPAYDEDPHAAFDALRNEVSTVVTNARLDLSEDLARERHADFDEKFALFEQMVQDNPHLLSEIGRATNPAERMYTIAANHQKLQQAGSLDALKEQMRAELRAEIEADMKAKEDADAKKRAALPNTLSDTTSAGKPETESYAGPTPLNSILGS